MALSVPLLDCPPFPIGENYYGLYFTIISDVLSGILLIVHPYVSYCIVFRSPAQMNSYRWYLLCHQFFSASGDIYINVLSRPVILLPLPVGWTTGILKNIVSPLQTLAIGQFMIEGTCAAALHLFIFRYLAVHNKTYFPLWCWLLAAWNYILPLMNLIATATANVNTPLTFKEWQQTNPCIPDELKKIPNILAYDKMECLKKTISFVLISLVNFTVQITYFGWASMSAIKVKIMSEQLRQLQRKFFLQLVLQTAIPTITVVIPITLTVISVTFQLWIPRANEILWSNLSLFGVSGGIVLIVMNPTYHWWLTKLICKQGSSGTRTIELLRSTTINP